LRRLNRQVAEDNIWLEEAENGGRLKRTALKAELHNLYSSPNIIKTINSRRMR
jgi:hypothetical protein